MLEAKISAYMFGRVSQASAKVRQAIRQHSSLFTFARNKPASKSQQNKTLFH
jgi:hypothetical protein